MPGPILNSVETAIRAALEKGDHANQSFRRRIYASASAALERSLAARDYSDAEISLRRTSLIETISHIENEFRAAFETDPAPLVVSNPSQDERTSEVLDALVGRPVTATVETPERRPTAKRVKIRQQPQSRPWLKYALYIAALAALVLVGFWAYAEGKRIYAEATGPRINGQRPELAETNSADAVVVTDWIDVFSARDTDLISTAQGAKAEIISRDGVNYVVMSGDNSSEISIKIGAGLVQTFAGKRVLFNVKARSLNGEALEMGAHCDFGVDTKCERKRFKIGPQAAEYMFAVLVSVAARGDGALLIAPDLTGVGSSVEIETIRATIVKPDAS